MIADMLPSDEAAHGVALRSDAGGAMATVGDGIDDAPALAAADVGIAIAIATVTDVAMHAGVITLMRGDPRPGAAAIDIATRTVAKVCRKHVRPSTTCSASCSPRSACARR